MPLQQARPQISRGQVNDEWCDESVRDAPHRPQQVRVKSYATAMMGAAQACG